jgi:hypothetical protein
MKMEKSLKVSARNLLLSFTIGLKDLMILWMNVMNAMLTKDLSLKRISLQKRASLRKMSKLLVTL